MLISTASFTDLPNKTPKGDRKYKGKSNSAMLWCLNLLSVTFRGCSHTQEGRRATPRRESTFVWLGTKTHCGMSSTTPWARTRLYTKDEQRQLSKGLSPHLLPYYACSVTVHLKFCWPRLSPQGSCRATAPDRNSLFLKESCGWAGRVLAYRAWNPGLVTSNNPGMKTHVCNSSTQEGRQRWEFKSHLPSATKPELHTRLTCKGRDAWDT